MAGRDQSRPRGRLSVRRGLALSLLPAAVVILSSCGLLRRLPVSTTVESTVKATALPSLSINNASAAEGNVGTVRVTFTATLSATSTSPVTVHYATANGTALAPGDFGAVSGTKTISPGQRSTTITVLVKGDRVVEPTETFSVNLSVPTNATIATGRGTGTITNDDPTPSLAIADVIVTEGNSGTTNAVFSVTLSAPSSSTVTLSYATADGSASAPSDYASANGTLVFPPLSTSRTLTVSVKGDTTGEANETFFVSLFNVTHASIADGTAQGTIRDDDFPSVLIGDVTVAEGNSGTTDAVFLVTLSVPKPYPVTVDYATLDASATSPSDYAQAMDTLTFSPGETSKTITIAVAGDTVVEPDETFYVHLTNAVSAAIADGFGQGMILNDDVVVPSLSISSPAAISEGNSGTTNVVFTATLSTASASTVAVDYTTVDGSAAAPSDYTAQSGTLTYTPGQTSKQIAVVVNGDTTVETNETFTVSVSNPVNATIAGTGIGTATITNDDALPTVTIAAPAAANEGNSGTTNFVFTATLSAPSASIVTVDYTTADGSATAPSDYTAVSGTLTYSPGQTSKQIAVAVNGDTTVEADETVLFGLLNPTNAVIANTGVGVATITNDDTLPTLTIAAPAAANEGNSGTTNFVFTVTMSAVSANTVAVDYSTADGSAVAPSDYTAVSGTLTYSPGQTSKQIAVAVSGDTAVETNETFTVNVANPTNATIVGAGIGTATITNDDTLPTVTIAAPAAANEGNSGTTSFVFTATLSAVSTNTVTVDYATADGSATAASGDYTTATGTLTFSPGQASKQITVFVSGDTTVETNETFTVNLANPTNATIAGTGIGTATVNNDDTLPGLTLAAPAATNEGNSGTTNFVFTATLSAPSASTVTVDYTTVDGSATAPSDYTAQNGTVTFSAGQTTKPITILVNGDTANEINETFTVNLANPANATITTASASATITNDDTPPTLTIAAPAAANEGNSGTTNFVFTVTLSAVSANTVTVDYATADGSAAAASDYAAQSGTLTFTSGQTSKQITVFVSGDTTVETNETFTVNLANPTNATIAGTGIGTATVNNDDTLPTVTIAAPAATNEGNSGTTNFVFTVTLSAPSASTVTVDYGTADGSAAASSDYTAQSGTVSFSAGQTSKPITIAVSGDTTVETNETFTVNLANPTNATITTASVSATITNDDTLPTLTITSPAAVTEGNAGTTVNAVFTVTLSAISANTVTVDYTTADGSATAASGDYTTASGTLTFSPGQTSQQIAVIVKGDTLNEINETFTVNLSNPGTATIAGTGIGTETINNDDAVPTLSINNVTLVEGTGGTTNFVFTVTLSAASGLPVTVDFATVAGTAVAPGDFASQAGTLTFSPGQTTKTITVAVVADAVNEANEAFTVVLSNPANATITTATGTGTITNDD